MEILGRQDGDLGDLPRAFEIGLELLDARIGRRNRGIGVVVDGAVRVKLVADQAFRAERHHLRGLVFERLRLLEAAELAPARVELAGVADIVEAEEGRVAGARRKVIVAPAAGRQAFELEVGVGAKRCGPCLWMWPQL